MKTREGVTDSIDYRSIQIPFKSGEFERFERFVRERDKKKGATARTAILDYIEREESR